MTKTYAMFLILALGAPAAAELAAPELPFIDAAVVRAQPFEKGDLNIDAAFVKRPGLAATVQQNGGRPAPVTAPAGAPKAAALPAIADGKYANASGCIVEAENRANGAVLYVEERGQRAIVGVLNDLSGGDIAAFCGPAGASFAGGVLTLGCREQNNGGLPTRGTAELDLRGGLNAVRVRGEVKKTLGWKTDTDISCEGLRLVR